MQKQKVLTASSSLKEKGLHTGLNIGIALNPASENHGYKIKRVDVGNQPTVDALAENVVSTQRGAVPNKNGIRVSTIEHTMAALYTYEANNCLIGVDTPEFPILGGSSRSFSEEVQKTRAVEQNASKDYYIIKHEVEVKDEETGSSSIILPDDKFSVNILISFGSPVFSGQFATLNDLSEFPTELAASRMFVFVHEVEMSLNHNLIKGDDLDNAIVTYDQKIPQEFLDKLVDMLNIPHKNVQELGYVNNKPFVFDDEPACHRLVDMIGDTALTGKPIRGCMIATRLGHKINNQLVRMIRKDIKMNEVQAPTYDSNRKLVMNINRIRELLPHRYPFLLVDKIIEVGGDYIAGVENIMTNKPSFQGHFPQELVIPGVLQIEVITQTGDLLVLNSVDEPERYSIYSMKIDDVKFHQRVIPGDTLILRLELLAPIRRRISTMKGYVFAGDKLVSEAELTVRIVKGR